MNAIMPRDTVAEIVSARDKALALYEVAHAKIIEAADAEEAAMEMAKRAFMGCASSYTSAHAGEVKAFFSAVTRPDREGYLRTARRLIDLSVWGAIIQRTDLERLMDKEAKDQLRKQMAYVPEKTNHRGELINADEIEAGMPPVTEENIIATLERFAGDAGMIFHRGVANAFSKLDRRFKSHDGFKVGSRMIIDHAFNEFGSWSFYRNHQDTLMDIERAFTILDGKGVKASYAGIVGVIDEARRGRGFLASQSEHEGDYFRVRIFKNGNMHLWFTRKDLVEKVNRILADWYGATIADGQATPEDPFANVKHTPARNFGFFPTPDDAAERAVGSVSFVVEEGKHALRVLEPSAGTGNLARRCLRAGREPRNGYVEKAVVDVVEIQPALVSALSASGLYARVYAGDFLRLEPSTTGLYDRVVMNPPFDRERDIDHVVHALKFLKPDGILVAIMSAGTEFRETKKSEAFRAMIAKLKGRFTELPAGSFSSVGTNVNTVILRVSKAGRDLY